MERDKMDEDDWGQFQCMSNKGLIQIALTKVDAVKIAKENLAGRGVDHKGNWIGFDKAAKVWKLS